MNSPFHINNKSQTNKNVLAKSLIFLFYCFSILQETAAQQKGQIDSADVASITYNLIRHYQSNFTKTSNFYNGAEYIRPLPGTKGHPFLDTDTLQNGNVFFDGILYQDVMIAYDLVTGVLITIGYQNINLIPVPHKIGYFMIKGRLFIPLPNNLEDKSGIQGYFEMLYQNELKVLAHYKKAAVRAFKAEDPYTFKTYTTYYIQQQQKLVKIENEKKLLELFDNKKEDIKAFLRKNNLSFKTRPVPTMIKSIEYYMSIL